MLQWLFTISSLLIIGQTQAATNVGGVLLQNTIWTSAGSANPYNLINNVQIPRNVTLTIQAGVRIDFSGGDFEILVKGFLKIQGTLAQPVIFMGGLANHLKWMINFQSTQLSKSFINYAQFKGPKKALQLSNVASGLQQNTETLVLESSTFSNSTEIGANGNYPSYLFPSVPSLEFRSCTINQTTISSANTVSEPIRIINSRIFYVTFNARAGNNGLKINSSTVRHITVNYASNAGSNQFQLSNSNVMNTTVVILSGSSWISSSFIADKSVIRDFIIYFTLEWGGGGPTFIFEDSTMYNVSTSYPSDVGWYTYYATLSIFIRNCRYTLGNLTIYTYYTSNSISIRNSVLNKVHFIAGTSDGDSYNYPRLLTMRNVSFTDGTINLPSSQADISYATITLLSPPLSIGGTSRISCSSVGRSGSILQTNTTGIKATGLTLTNSTIKNFAVGLGIAPPSFNTATISNTNFISNSQYNIDNIGAFNVLATGIYWGTNSGAVVVSKINDYWDDINFGEVIYTNYASAPLPAEKGCPPYAEEDPVETTESPT